jgi:anti-sigma factor RsiW
MNEHSEIRELLTLAAAGVLSAAEQRRVEEHLPHCDACRAEFHGWSRLTGALQKQPTPQAPPDLVRQTRRMLELRAQALHERRQNHFVLGMLVLLGWTLTLLNWPVLHLLDGPLRQWFNVSSTQLNTLWVTYMLAAWIATALAVAVLGRRRQQEGRTL